MDAFNLVDNNIDDTTDIKNYDDNNFLIKRNYSDYEINLWAQQEKIVGILVPIFFGIITLTGIFGNLLVILVVIFNPQMRSTTNFLITNLAFADLLFVIFCIPFTASDYVFYKWPYGEWWCKIVQYLIVVTASASIYTLVLMSLDRFLAVVYPISSRTVRTEKKTKICIVILWTIILILASPALFTHGLVEYIYKNHQYLSCRYLEDTLLPLAKFNIIFMTTTYFLPLLLISGLYMRIVSRLWRKVSGTRMSAESQRGRKRVTRLVVIVVLTFAILWFPIQIILVLKSVDYYFPDTLLYILIQVMAQTLAYSSACVNPLLYGFFSENFRKAFRKFFFFTSSYNRQYSAAPSSNIINNYAGRRISAAKTSTSFI